MFGKHAAHRPKRRVKLTYRLRDAGSRQRHTGAVNAVALDEQGERLYTAGRDSVVRQWNVGAPGDAPTHAGDCEGHTDWVNDVVVCHMGSQPTLVASVSSDRTVRVWQAGGDGRCHEAKAITKHKDYVKAAAFARDPGLLLTAGLDGCVWTTDLRRPDDAEAGPAVEHPQSVYCVGVNSRGTVAALGSVDKVLRLWDPRTNNTFGVLKGHHDMVKAVAVSEDGTRCLSGGSDKLLKLWDIGERRCIATFRPHEDSVWCLRVEPQFRRVYSGGRDGAVFVTSLNGPSGADSVSTQVLKEQSSVLSLAVAADERTLWTSSLLGGVTRYVLPGASSQDGGAGGGGEQPAVPASTLEPEPALTRFRVLADGVTVCTHDTAGNAKLWSLTTGKVVQDLGETPFDDAVEKHDTERCHVGKWCGLDTALGVLSVHLEEREALAGWTQARRLWEGATDRAVNIGFSVVQALLHRYEAARRGSLRSDDGEAGAATANGARRQLVTLPDHTPVILLQTTEPACTLCQLTVGSAAASARQLDKHLPEWLRRILSESRAVLEAEKAKVPQAMVTLHPRKEKGLPAGAKKLPHVSAKPFKAYMWVTVRSIKQEVAEKLAERKESVEPAEVLLFYGDKELRDATEVGYVRHTLAKRADLLLEYCRK